jgi:hypothetical protein
MIHLRPGSYGGTGVIRRPGILPAEFARRAGTKGIVLTIINRKHRTELGVIWWVKSVALIL